MPLVSDVTTYLAGASLGLTVGSTGNLINVPFSDVSPQAVVCIIQYSGRPAVRAFGASIGAPVCEVHRFQITARDIANNFSTAQALIESIHAALDHLGESTLSGTRYLNVTAVAPPFYLGQDDDDRHRFVCNFEAWKER